MSFKQAGSCMVVLSDVLFSESKFGGNDPNAFDVNIKCTHAEDDSQVDWWRGEFSNNYGKGNLSTKTQAEITFQTLRKIGFEGEDLSDIARQIAGKRVPAMVKESKPTADGKVFYNISYIGASGGNAPDEDKVIGTDKVKERLAALLGSAGDAPKPEPQQQVTPPPPAAASNPFGKTVTQPAAAGTPPPAAKPTPAASKSNPFARK